MQATSLRWRGAWLLLGWLMVGLVMWVSLMPHPPRPLAFPQADKLEHAAAFAWLALWFLQLARPVPVLLGLALLGVGIEIAQGFTDMRQFEALDILADGLGMVLGLWLVTTAAGRLLAALDRFAQRICTV